MAKTETGVRHLEKSGAKIFAPAADRAPSERGTRADETRQQHYLMTQDFGSSEMTQGRARIEEMHVIQGLKTETGWHYHELDFHVMCTIKGNLTVEFEDGIVQLGPGMRMQIPGGTPHRGIQQSPDWEGIEFTLPAKFKTVAIERPAAAKGTPLN